MFDTPELPAARGPLSQSVISALRGGEAVLPQRALDQVVEVDDDDLQLALYLCYELHYRGWSGVPAAAEWSPPLLALRSDLEDCFLQRLEALVPRSRPVAPTAVPRELEALIAATDGPSLSSWVERRASLRHLQELAIHRSLYQLKEADPHTWAIPRLPAGAAKSALLTLQFDEYGNGEAGASHAELFADTMRSLGLDAGYGHYLDLVPGVTLASVNLLSMFGLHRSLVGACIGHLAVFEMTSVVPMTRYAQAHRRVTGGDEGAEFYDAHVIADTLHARIAIDELVPGAVAGDRQLASDVLFGAEALLAVEARFADRVIDAWKQGCSSLTIRHELAAAS
jgi:hypothetical protein